MKVNIYETVHVTDEQRVAIAREIDGEAGKKRQATRDEIKDFIWTEGKNWSDALSGDAPSRTEAEAGPADDDLLGTTEDEDEDLI